MIVVVPWINFILHTLIIGNPIISWFCSLVIIVFISWFCLVQENSRFIKYVFLPLSLISTSGYDFYSGKIFATGFFQYLSLDLFCILIIFFRFIMHFLNFNKTIKLLHFLTMILLLLCLISSILGYFSNFKNYNWILYLPVCFVVFSYIGELRDKGHIVDAENYSKILLLIYLISLIILGIERLSHAYFILMILILNFFLRVNLKKFSYLSISLVLTFLLIISIYDLQFFASFTTTLFIVSFLICFIFPFSISFFYKQLIHLCSAITAIIIIFSIKLPRFISDFRVFDGSYPYFEYLNKLIHKFFEDRCAMWFGALNKVIEEDIFYNLLRPAGEYFVPSISKVFYYRFGNLEWSGLSHSSFIEVYFHAGLLAGIICFILIEKLFNVSYGNLKSTNYLLISFFILLFLGNFIVTKSILIFWVFLGLYANKNGYNKE